MIRTAKFDGSNTALSGFSTSGWFVRSDVTVDDSGNSVGANVPRYGRSTLLCPAPSMLALRDPRPAQSWIWSGRWSDGSPCIVENWAINTQWYIGVSQGAYSISPDRTTTMSAGRTFLPAMDPGWLHVPTSCIIADGLILMFCIATELGGEGEDDLIKAVSCVYFDDSILPHGGWVFKHRGDPVQFNPDASDPGGHNRGQMWMATGPWVPPGGTDGSGNILDFFVAWVDYRANGVKIGVTEYGSTGGQLYLMRCQRIAANQPWALGGVIKVYEELFEVVATGDLVSGYPMGDRKSFMHFHGAAITFPPAVSSEGDVLTQPMVITLVAGDSAANNRLLNIRREDYTTYDDGPAQNPYTGTAAGTWPAPVGSANGWSTYEDRDGQRQRFAVKDAVYDGAAVPPTLDHAAFANYTHPGSGSVTPMIITRTDLSGVFKFIEIVGIIGNGAGNKVQLSRTLFDPPASGLVDGFLFANSSVQGVLIQPNNDPQTIVFGGDEQGTSICDFHVGDDAADRIDIVVRSGAPTHSAINYQSSSVNICMGWLCFVGTHRRGSDSSISHYAAMITPSSIDGGDHEWKSQELASVVMYSPDGINWGELYAPNTTFYTPFGFQDTFSGSTPKYFFGGRLQNVTNGVYSIPCPPSETLRLRQPLLISPGGTNHLRRYPNTGLKAIQVSTISAATYGLSGIFNSATAVSPAALGVPLPPTSGPVMRLQFVDQADMGLWTLTDAKAFSGVQRVRVRFWVFRMPTVLDTADPNEMPANSTTSFFLQFLFSNTTPAHTSDFAGERLMRSAEVGGTGKWIPMTMEFNSGVLSNASGVTYQLYAFWNYQQSFNRQDILIAWDFIQITPIASYADMAARPLPQPATLGAAPLTSPLEKMVLTHAPIALPEPPVLSEWAVFVAARLPESGPDPFVNYRASNLDAITLFSITDGYGRFLRVVLHREADDAACTIRIYDQAGAMWEIAGPADDGTLPDQPFYFLRGRQILFGISSVVEGDEQHYFAWVSCGGSRVQFRDSAADLAVPLSMVLPNAIRSGNASGTSPDSVEFFGVWVDEDASASESIGYGHLQTLDFLV